MPNIICLKCDHRWWSDITPSRCANRNAGCQSRRLQVSEVAMDIPLSTPTPDAPQVPPSAIVDTPATRLEAKCKAEREAAGAILCVHGRWFYPPEHEDYKFGCPSCIELAKPKRPIPAQFLAELKAGNK